MQPRLAKANLAAALLALAITGCTSSPTKVSAPDPSTEQTSDTNANALTPVAARLALDDALDAFAAQESVRFTSRAENVIDDDVTKITGSGVWTSNPLAWKSTITYDSPRSAQDLSSGERKMDLIYLGSRPLSVYSRATYQGLPPFGWGVMPGLGVREGVTRADLTTPPSMTMLRLTEASAAVEVGDTLAISGSIPTSWALSALDLDGHLGDLGFLNRFDESTTRVLVTVGPAGLPQTLEFTGTNIGSAEADLPDYVAAELGGARYFAEYGTATLDGPIKAPPSR